jgi:thiol-disulfide isomerase/thioredoxin
MKNIILGVGLLLIRSCQGQESSTTALPPADTHKMRRDSLKSALPPSDTAKVVLTASGNEEKVHSSDTAKVVLTASENEETVHTVLPPNWHAIETFDSTIAFSKIARLGKISVFVVSTAWCAPCRVLKRDLLAVNAKYQSQIDFYYINMCAKQPYDALKNTDAYFYARMFDRLKEWPRVVITAPTGSIVKQFSQEDLIAECQRDKLFKLYEAAAKDPNSKFSLETAQSVMASCGKTAVYDKIIEVVDRMLPHVGRFHSNKVVTQLKKAGL